VSIVTEATQIIGYSVGKIGEAIRSVGGSTAAAWEIAVRETFMSGLVYSAMGLSIMVGAILLFRLGFRRWDQQEEDGKLVAAMVLGGIGTVVGLVILGFHLSDVIAPNKELARQVILAMKGFR